jgi:glycosyltransferase involved in cell wall biosynthesis
MKILHLMPYCPVPPTFGGALRIYNLLKSMVRYNEVTLVTTGSDLERRLIMDEFGDKLQNVYLVRDHWMSKHRRLGQVYALGTRHSYFHLTTSGKELHELIEDLVEREDFDIIQTEFPAMGLLRLKTPAVRILDAHNVEYENFRRMWANTSSFIRKGHYFREYKKLFIEEIEACRNQQAMFVTSRHDKEIFDRDVPEIRKFIIPNGVDTTFFTPSHTPEEPNTLVFIGMMAYVPNYDGMVFFLDEIFPLIKRKIPHVKLYIVGNRPPSQLLRRASSDVIITGFVEDVRKFISRAAVYIVPLRMGSGTRLKILEAMAMQKAIVTTPIGCEGIEVSNGDSLCIEGRPESFAEKVVELLQNSGLRRKLGMRGYDVARSRYDWKIIGEAVESAYSALVRKTVIIERAEMLQNQNAGSARFAE